MPRQVRNALVCNPSPVLVDLDLVKCYPSIMALVSQDVGDWATPLPAVECICEEA